MLTPSWLSGLIACLIALAIVGGTLALPHFNSYLNQGVLGLHTVTQHNTLTNAFQTVSERLSNNNAVNTALLFVLWCPVGLAVYYIAESIVRGLTHIDSLSHEFGYVNANRESMRRAIIWRAVLRIAAVAGWWLALHFTLYKVIPYAIATARVTTLHDTNAGYWLRSVAMAVACALCVQVITALLRLMVLRPRLWGEVPSF